MTLPLKKNKNGIGINSRLRNANVELAHSGPRFAYMPDANKGNPAPNRFRIRMTPASALAAYVWYASTTKFRIPRMMM